MPVDITWGQELSGGPVSWTWPSYLGDSGPIPCGRSTKTLPATQLRRKERKKKTKTKKQTDRTLGQMVKANLYRHNHTEKHTHTHSQKEKKKKKRIYIGKKRKRATKPINKSTNDNKL